MDRHISDTCKIRWEIYITYTCSLAIRYVKMRCARRQPVSGGLLPRKSACRQTHIDIGIESLRIMAVYGRQLITAGYCLEVGWVANFAGYRIRVPG